MTDQQTLRIDRDVATDDAARFEPAWLDVWVPGDPRPAGSKRSGIVTRKEGGRRVPVINPATGMPRTFTTDASGDLGKTWREDVRGGCERQLRLDRDGDLPLPLEGPVWVEVTFCMRRPKAHFGTGRNAAILKLGAPRWHTKAPDVDKLSRAVLDALKALVWMDDAQVVLKTARKPFSHPPGAHIVVGRVR